MELTMHTIDKYPDLREKSDEVELDEIPKMQDFFTCLAKKMDEKDGVGIAAPQVGHKIRVIVIANQYAKTDEHLVLINPRIVSTSKKTDIVEEGCLSVPGIYGTVERPTKARIKGYNINGEKIDIKAKGMLARVFLHEIDHLDGILFIDKALNTRESASNLF